MDYEAAKRKVLWDWSHGDGNPVIVAELYHDDALLGFPQSGEGFRVRDNFTAGRAEYPSEVEFGLRSLRGEGDLWVGEGLGRLRRWRPYALRVRPAVPRRRVEREPSLTEPFPADEARTPYAEDSELDATPGLPVKVVAGPTVCGRWPTIDRSTTAVPGCHPGDTGRLPYFKSFAPGERLELSTHGLTVHCSAN